MRPLSRLAIDHSIVGPLYLPVDMDYLDVMDSIIDALEQDRSAITGAGGQQPGPPTTLQRTTVFGKVHVQELELASETIFTAPVTVVHRQVGCVRFSYLPAGSIAPRRYRC